jgi:glutamate synthase domain-containing protein 3
MTGGRVAVLGDTGRNFAAGMSGGIAYVYDPLGVFPPKCNMDMVDLKPMRDKSLEQLQQMLENHVKYTDSPVARKILQDWEVEQRHFVRVMPREYARAMRQLARKTAEVLTYVSE